MKRLAKVWILLSLSYAAGRLAVGYAAAGYLPISGQTLAEVLTIPAFQAIWLLSLLQALEPPGLLRLTARAFRHHPFLGLWLFLDAFVVAAALLTGVHQWLRLTSPAELIYTYFGLRFLLLAGSARRTAGIASIMVSPRCRSV